MAAEATHPLEATLRTPTELAGQQQGLQPGRGAGEETRAQRRE